MPKFHRFKLLPTHCATASAKTTSPAASPRLRHRRRRQTLRTLLLDHRHRHDPPETADKDAGVRVRVRHKLKDLLLSSPIGDDKMRRRSQRQEQEGFLPAVPASGGLSFRFRTGSVFRRGGAFAAGGFSSGFRHRVVRRAWRPMLLTIPE